jgi:hypothetical protein
LEENDYKVYMHKNKINNKVYIGITKQKPQYRWNDGNGYKTQLFYKAILKYGWDNFEHYILFEHLTKQEAEYKEIQLIKKYNSHCGKYGYNVLNDINKHRTERNLRKKRKKREVKEKTKEKLRKANLGKHLSLETKNKLSKLRKGKSNFKNMKKIICIETNIIYNGLIIASQKTNINFKNIQSVCSGRSKTAGGYHWQYYDLDKSE